MADISFITDRIPIIPVSPILSTIPILSTHLYFTFTRTRAGSAGLLAGSTASSFFMTSLRNVERRRTDRRSGRKDRVSWDL